MSFQDSFTFHTKKLHTKFQVFLDAMEPGYFYYTVLGEKYEPELHTSTCIHHFKAVAAYNNA
uniref:Uncharacterized protein n=1 Tax=Anguilla anguilla TaxID=7936 RepID=A0A0E9W3A2_ANGAN